MSNYSDDAPVARGRRDPNLASMLDAERELVYDEASGDVGNEEAEYALLPGDTIMAKTTLAYKTRMGDAWSTFGAQTHVLDGESVDDAFERLSGITTEGVIELAKSTEQRVAEELNQQPRTRIQPRH